MISDGSSSSKTNRAMYLIFHNFNLINTYLITWTEWNISSTYITCIFINTRYVNKNVNFKNVDSLSILVFFGFLIGRLQTVPHRHSLLMRFARNAKDFVIILIYILTPPPHDHHSCAILAFSWRKICRYIIINMH